MTDLALPTRTGEAPATSQPAPGVTDPAVFVHRQLTQTAPVTMQAELFTRASSLEGVEVAPSQISVPGARGFFLRPPARHGPAEAFMVGDEFAHLHPAEDGSLHLGLPADVHAAVLAHGWGEPHPLVGTPLLYGPRDPAELEVVWQVFLCSYRFARGG
ncbi:MAG: luciferase family protein [Micromonosporaceae bacterium]